MIPHDLDAVSGWWNYTACRGCTLGLMNLAVLPYRGSPRECVLLVVGGYCIACLETFLIFVPTLLLGMYWISDQEYYPFCLPETFLMATVGCNAVAIFVYVFPIVV